MSSNIPSEEDFARAKKFMADENRHLSAVVKSVESRFLSRCPMHRVFLLVQDDVDFRAYVFFKTESDENVKKKCNGDYLMRLR